jgi:hypothetical protein
MQLDIKHELSSKISIDLRFKYKSQKRRNSC